MAEWDSLKTSNHDNAQAATSNGDRRKSVASRRAFFDGTAVDGLLDPLAFIRFIFRNIFKILILTALFTALGLSAVSLISFPYKATAIVLVDPREKGVTISEQVRSNIDGDAAVLESVVQLIQSDGFLRPIVKKLKAIDDPVFEDARAAALSGDDRPLLDAFKKKLSVFRLGATYVVEIAFTSPDPERSAFYANGVAEAFVEEQKTSGVAATTTAANSLSSRLTDLRNALLTSEEAVARFRANNNIISIDGVSTLQQRELTELSQQIALAKTATEVARAQYTQISASNATSFNTLGDQTEAEQLRTLRQQRSLVSQTLAELSLTFGSRHPRIAAEQSKLTALDGQITLEMQRLVSLSKKRLDAAIATQDALEADLQTLRNRASSNESKLVTLGELEREAAANRSIYEEFLSRFKSADEQKGFQNQQVRLASRAIAPLFSTRPSLTLITGVLGILSFALSTALIFMREAFAGKRPAFKKAAKEKPEFRKPFEVMDGHASKSDLSEKALEAETLDRAENEQKPAKRQSRPRRIIKKPTSQPMDTASVINEQPVSMRHGQTKRPVFTPKAPKPSQPKTPAAVEAAPAPMATPCVGLPHISGVSFGDEYYLETALANELAKTPHLLHVEDKSLNEAAVLLVSSWLPQEGKTVVAQAIANFAASRALDPLLVKTPKNSIVESGRGSSAAALERPYSILDPVSERASGLPVDLQSFAAQKSVIEECRRQFGLIVIDASNVADEAHFQQLSAICDKTLLLLNEPTEQRIKETAYRSVRSNLKNSEIILNNL